MNGKAWTKAEVEILERMYPDHFASEIAQILGRDVHSIYNKAAALGRKSNREKLVKAGMMSSSNPNTIAAQFRKGHIPDNKGRKVSAQTYAKMQPTMFKKGNRPHNHMEVGSERVNVDGYVEIKVAEPGTWKLKHRIVWEQANGKIPKGYNIQFRNHDPLDVRLENLYMISRAEQLATQNSYLAKYPKELQDVIRLKGAVKRVIRNRDKDGK